MKCKFIYKDPEGNSSSLYDAAERRYGPEKAEEIYVRRMMRMIDTKFSLPLTPSIEEIRRSTENLNLVTTDVDPEDADKPRISVDGDTNESFEHVTSFLAALVQKSEQKLSIQKPDFIAKAKATQAENLINQEYGKSVFDEFTDDYKNEIRSKASKDIDALWNAKPETGTQLHRIMELTALHWEAMRDEDPSIINDKGYSVTHEAVRRAYEQMRDEGENPTFDYRGAEAVFDAVIKEVRKKENLLKDKDGNPRRIYLRPEVKIKTNKLIPPGQAIDGLTGSIDLMLETAEGDYKGIIDYKTSSRRGMTEYGRILRDNRIGEPFNRAQTKEGMARAQELLYATILKTEYNCKVDDTMTIHIPVEMGLKEYGMEFGSREFVGRGIAKGKDLEGKDLGVETTGFVPVGNDLNQILTYFREKGDMKSYYDAARAAGINGIVETWSGRNANGTPNATFAKYNREAAVKDKLESIRTLSTGKRVIDIFGRTITVTNWPESKIRAEIERIYDEEKAIYNQVANNIIDIFEHPNDINRFPTHLKGREIPIMKLLAGFDPETHKMELAQSYDYLKDVGPDIIIVTDKRSGAVSFLSAITTNDTQITFQTDGSGKKRTGLLGNYVTDDYYVKTAVSDEIFTSPTTHDFIAMKLGMTALRWMNAHGYDIKIDSMKVGSILLSENSYSVTPTTLLQEIRKLQMFREVAGEDFPKDIAEIMDKMPRSSGVTSDKGKVSALMSMIMDSCDPLGKHISNDFKNGFVKSYMDYAEGGIMTYEFKYNMVKYMEMVARHLRQQGKSDAAILTDPEYLLVTRAISEMEKFDFATKRLAAERINVKYTKSAITSGDPILLRMNVIYRTESGNIRQEMNSYQREHNKLIDDLRRSKGMTFIGAPEKLFENMFIKDDLPEHRMMLKEEGTPEFNMLTKEEQAYIRFFNEHCRKALSEIAPAKYKNDILKTERFWKEGSIPVILKQSNLLDPKNFTSWQALKTAVIAEYKSKIKSTTEKISDINFVFETHFDGQATDEGLCNSDKRRSMLGLTDPSNPGTMNDNIEQNLALILNLATLEASEKKHMGYVLHIANAMSSVLEGEDDEARTGMTKEMLEAWRNMNLFNKSRKEPNATIAGFADVIGKAMSSLIFNYSIRQSGMEFMQNTSHSLSALAANTIMDQVSKFLGIEGNARFAPKDWAWASNILNYGNKKYEQMIYDAGMLQADVDDLKDENFKALSKASKIRSKSAQAANRIWFHCAVSQVFLAQMKAQGITDAYVLNKKTGEYEYDETKDPRFFVWDPTKNIGEREPLTDEERKRNAKWLTSRKIMNEEGMLTKPTYNEDGSINDPGGKMTRPLIGDEAAEIKAYSLRLFGAFDKDGKSLWEMESLFRAMGKYKTWWFVQRLANLYTPEIKDEPMYGKWVVEKDENGEWKANWTDGDYRGTVQAIGHITKELIKYRDISVLRNLDRYEQETVAHLISDMLILALIALLVMPLVANKQVIIDENGKEKIIKGGFANTTTGDNVYKILASAVGDLASVTSFDSMTKSMFPALSIASNLGKVAFEELGHVVAPLQIPAPTGKAWQMIGAVRTYSIFDELRKGEWDSTINTLQ